MERGCGARAGETDAPPHPGGAGAPRTRDGACTNEGCADRRAVPLVLRGEEKTTGLPGAFTNNTGGGALAKCCLKIESLLTPARARLGPRRECDRPWRAGRWSVAASNSRAGRACQTALPDRPRGSLWRACRKERKQNGHQPAHDMRVAVAFEAERGTCGAVRLHMRDQRTWPRSRALCWPRDGRPGASGGKVRPSSMT